MSNLKYIITIIGFNNVKEAITATEAFMKEEGIWLFTIVGSSDGIAKEVAASIGAPFQYVQELWQLERECNYIIADVRNNNQNVKNFVMKMKAAGKHGRVVR